MELITYGTKNNPIRATKRLGDMDAFFLRHLRVTRKAARDTWVDGECADAEVAQFVSKRSHDLEAAGKIEEPHKPSWLGTHIAYRLGKKKVIWLLGQPDSLYYNFDDLTALLEHVRKERRAH